MTKFWTEDLCALFSSWNIFPTPNLSRDEKLNALTRLLLVVTLVMVLVKFEHATLFLVVGLILILLLHYTSKKEGFTITPTYTTTNFLQTEVAPTYSEEWQNPPPIYNTYEAIPEVDEPFEEPPFPDRPYAQYLTRTNLLPSDEARLKTSLMGSTLARTYANSAILRNELAFRDNITRPFKLKLARRFRNSCNDAFSPFNSY